MGTPREFAEVLNLCQLGKWGRSVLELEFKWLGSEWQGGPSLPLGFTAAKLWLSQPLLLHSVTGRKTKGRREKKVKHRFESKWAEVSRTNVGSWGLKINTWVKVVVTGSLLNSRVLALILSFSFFSHFTACLFPITNHWLVSWSCGFFETNSNHVNSNTSFCADNYIQFAELFTVISFDLYSNFEEYIGLIIIVLYK